jgi:hypothetical protein
MALSRTVRDRLSLRVAFNSWKASRMFVDERIYTLHAGQVPVFLKLYEEEGMECQVRILGNMVGYYFTDFGPLNQIVHMWGYESLDDRFERRRRLLAAPEWQSYAKKMRPLVANVENKLLVPAPFFKVPKPAPAANG